MQAIASRLSSGQSISRGTASTVAVVEPALIYNMDRSMVTSMNLANADRTRTTAPDDCPEPTWDYPTGVVFISEKCLQGNIYIKGGYNCEITQDDANNSITIGAMAGAGEGQPCEEVQLFDGEAPPVGSNNSLYSGGLLCNETVRSINGIGGPLFTIYAGAGVSLIADPDNNKLTVDVDMQDVTACISEYITISENI
jgi:hypothetical protein